MCRRHLLLGNLFPWQFVSLAASFSFSFSFVFQSLAAIDLVQVTASRQLYIPILPRDPCGVRGVHLLDLGTEPLEEHLPEEFPQSPDRDSGKGCHEEVGHLENKS